MSAAPKRRSNGEGSIYFDERSQKWVASISWTSSNGVRQRKRFTHSKKTVVKNKLDEFKKQLLLADGNIKTKDVSFREFAEFWLKEKQKNKLKPSSYMRKVSTFNNQVYPILGGVPINEITHYDIQSMVNTLSKNGSSYSVVKKAYHAVNECLREYRVVNRLLYNPCENISLPEAAKKRDSDIVYFNKEQRDLIVAEATRLNGAGTQIYRMGYGIVVLMYTGLRIGELIALTWDDINFEEKLISVTKNAVVVKDADDTESHYETITQKSGKTYSSSRVIPMTEKAMEAFIEIKKINGDKDFVISTSKNRQPLPSNLNRVFHKVLLKSGVAKTEDELCGVHSLRHTFASMLFQNGCNIKIVSELLGHSSTKITENIYIHIIQSQKIKAMESLDKYID